MTYQQVEGTGMDSEGIKLLTTQELAFPNGYWETRHFLSIYALIIKMITGPASLVSKKMEMILEEVVKLEDKMLEDFILDGDYFIKLLYYINNRFQLYYQSCYYNKEPKTRYLNFNGLFDMIENGHFNISIPPLLATQLAKYRVKFYGTQSVNLPHQIPQQLPPPLPLPLHYYQNFNACPSPPPQLPPPPHSQSGGRVAPLDVYDRNGSPPKKQRCGNKVQNERPHPQLALLRGESFTKILGNYIRGHKGDVPSDPMGTRVCFWWHSDLECKDNCYFRETHCWQKDSVVNEMCQFLQKARDVA